MRQLFIFLCLYGCIFTLSAQNRGGGIRILDETEEEQPKRKFTRKGKIPANIIKFSFLGPFRGDYGLLYERRIKPWVSVQVGAGITTRDKVFERFTSGTFNSKQFQSSLGFSAKAGIRFYPIADGWMSGMFISPDFIYREYNLNANLTQFDANNNASPQKLKCGYRFKEYRLLVGQSYDFLFRNLYLEYYIGLVFRETEESIPLYQNNSQGAYYTRVSQSRFQPGIAFNASIGYAF